jgi:CRISPR-associated endoribonuclease Cas6
MNALAVARYQFNFEVQDKLHLNFYSGSMLRGVFGHALRHLACMTKMANCRECPLYRTCPYPEIFETPPPENHTLQDFSQIPPPYVIEPPPLGDKVYQVGETLSFSMVLIGRAIQQLPLIIFAWQRAFARGVAKYESRAKLLNVIFEPNQAQQQVIFNATENETVNAHNPVNFENALQSETLILEILTPLRIQQKGRVLFEDMQGRDFIMSLVRRYYLLEEFHGENYQPPNFAELSEKARAVNCETNFAWCSWDRYSNRQQQKIKMGGVLGDITLNGELALFLPLLNIGQWLHVGNKTSFGMGLYVIK